MLVEATSVKTVADRVFNLLKGYGFQIDTYNKEGEVVGDPADAIRFFVEDPNLLVTLNVPTEEIRLSISDNSEQTDTLRKQLSEIAKDYLMMLDFRVFGKTLKPSSEAINISREADMKEHNRMRKLAGLETIKEERTVVGCNDDQSLYMFLDNSEVNLGKTEEEIATKLKELGDVVDFDDMYYSSSMDFASECGFRNDDAAKELMDKAIDLYSEMKRGAVRDTEDKGPGRDATSDDIARINRGEEVTEEEDDDFVYASDVLFFDKSGKEIGYMDFDGYDDANSGHSEQELQAIAQKYNISPQDGKVVGYFDASEDEIDFSDPHNDETYPEGTIGVYIDSHSTEESIEEAEATIEDCIRKTLEKEGGAAGLGALEDACKEAGFEENCEDAIAKMSDVKKHEHGDYILEGKNCGCGQNPCKTYGTKKESVEELNDLRKRAGLPINEYDDDKPGEMTRYFLKQDFTQMSKKEASDIVGNIAYEVFPSYDMHEDPLDGALDELHDMLDSDTMSGYEYDGGEMDNPDVDAFELSDIDYKSLPEIQQMVRKSYIERLNDPDIKDELKGTPADNKGELPGMTVPQESRQAVEETIVVEASLGSMRGSIKTSNQPLGGTKIIVKHTKAVNEEVRGSRSRNIQKIFIENNEERFLFPSKNLNGARAMARHLYNGGQMHDTVGESIVAMCTELKTLKEFANYVKKQGLINEENNDYVELARQHISTIKETFKKLSGVKTYSKAVESLKDMDNIDVVNEVNLEDHFTETHFDDKVGKVHETISKLVNRQTAFESMIMKTIESENFVGIKELISEDPLDFATPEAKLGHQVSQLGSTAKNPQLASYLGSISNKLSNGGQMNQFEYRAVKASLLSAQRTDHAEMAHTVTEEEKYTDFINSFIQD